MNNELLINNLKSNNSEFESNNSEKQIIEEMARVLCEDCERAVPPCSLAKSGRMCDSVREQAEALYNADYRKQSDKGSSKGCEYCKGRAYTKKPLTVITKYGRRIELVFEFCPNCGRKMKGGVE